MSGATDHCPGVLTLLPHDDAPSPEPSQATLGHTYNCCLRDLMERRLGLETNDRVCYVGHDAQVFVPLLRQRYVLTEPVTIVSPNGRVRVTGEEGVRESVQVMGDEGVRASGPPDTREDQREKDLPPTLFSIEDFFRHASGYPGQFTKMVLKDALWSIKDWPRCLANLLRTLTPTGRLLVVHRPASLISLPLPVLTRAHLAGADRPLGDIVGPLEGSPEGLEVRCEVELVPWTLRTREWIDLAARHAFPPPLRVQSDARAAASEEASALRELRSGPLRYVGDTVQLTDRLVFVTATRRLPSPSIPRTLTSTQVKHPSGGARGKPGTAAFRQVDSLNKLWVDYREKERSGGRFLSGKVRVDVDTEELRECARELLERDRRLRARDAQS